MPALKPIAIKLGWAILAIFAPVGSVLAVVLLLTAIDLVTGVIAARKRGEVITSSGFKRTIIKLFVYEVVIILSFLIEQYLTGPFVPIENILAGYIGITELKSVLENLESITGVPILQTLIDKLTNLNQ